MTDEKNDAVQIWSNEEIECLNAVVKDDGTNRLLKAKRRLEEAQSGYDASLEYIGMRRRAINNLSSESLIVCVINYNQGYGQTFEYVRCWASKEIIESMDQKGVHTHQCSGAAWFLSELIKKGLHGEPIGAYKSACQPYDVLIHAPKGTY